MWSGHTNNRCMVTLLALVIQFANVYSFNNSIVSQSRAAPRKLHATPSENDEAANKSDISDSPATVKIDDGGSDLTDRFKYKVHALMGSYDPPSGAVDDENQTGNIIGGILEFPTEYTFTVVGKNKNNQLEDEESAGDAYADEVKQALRSVLGSDAKMETRVVPRGKKFTRVSLKVTVESASVISTIYDELDALEATVMKF